MPDTSIPQGYKRCSKCGEVKAVEEFSKHLVSKDGLRPSCRQCVALVDKQYRQNNADKVAEALQRWRKNNPEKAREQEIRRFQANPEKGRERARDWYQANAKQARESHRRRYQANPEKKREYNRLQYQANPEKARESHRRWCEANPEKGRERARRRLARKNGIIHAVPANIEEILFDVQNGYCLYCQCELLNGYELDHIVPLALVDLLGKDYPGHVPTNLCLACEHCNSSKRHTSLEDWLTRKYPEQVDEILQRVEKHIEIMKEWE